MNRERTVLHQILNRLDALVIGLDALHQVLRSLQPPQDRCALCGWFDGTGCLRHGSPHFGHDVSPRKDVCHLFQPAAIPFETMVAKVGPPKGFHKPLVEAIAHEDRAMCPQCGHLMWITRAGRFHRHDLNGKPFRGRSRADHSRECPGGAQSAASS